MLNTIREVDRDFGIMVGALPIEKVELIAAQLHKDKNRDASIIMRCLSEIDVYLVDPYRFGAVSLIGKLHAILLEAV